MQRAAHASPTVVIIGGGHAGAEAARAAWQVMRGAGQCGRVVLVTLDPSKIGSMSCNPANGGLGKGQLVREVDALGGIMGLATDATGIMFKVLNTRKGAAVRGPRAQCDREAYAVEVQRQLAALDGLEVVAGEVTGFEVEAGRLRGIRLAAGAVVVAADPRAVERAQDPCLRPQPVFALGVSAVRALSGTESSRDEIVLACDACVLTSGTFMRGLMHTGPERSHGGRAGEGAAGAISGALRSMGFELGRLKTGTPPRLRRDSLDWSGLELQRSDDPPVPMSDRSPLCLPFAAGAQRFPRLAQVDCAITRTSAESHDLIRANLHRAPMYCGQIEADCGPRYCPSIEDKVVRFADRTSHQVFLEPEGLHTDRVYCNGISTSLPIDVQERIVRTMPGCERAEILQWGYAVEYDMVWPHQIRATCETHLVSRLFLAGQINGTTGYEEAAAQGVLAGWNAASAALAQEPVTLARDQAYIGVMMDDLVTKTPREPYRMFTSRAEHRLHLRCDNAGARLTTLGRERGVVGDEAWMAHERGERERARVRASLTPALRAAVMRPEFDVSTVVSRDGIELDRQAVEAVLTALRYEPYVLRGQGEASLMREQEQASIPAWLDPATVTGLRGEAVEVLRKHRPATFGQAGRLSGVNPADLSILRVALHRQRASRVSDASCVSRASRASAPDVRQ